MINVLDSNWDQLSDEINENELWDLLLLCAKQCDEELLVKTMKLIPISRINKW